MKPDTEKVLSILAAHENNAANLIAILQDVQAEYNYLSEANLTLIADKMCIRDRGSTHSLRLLMSAVI